MELLFYFPILKSGTVELAISLCTLTQITVLRKRTRVKG
jgi:hypothetical protein